MDGILETSWELFWAMLARRGMSWGALGSIWSNRLAKSYRRQLLFYVVGLFGMLLGAHVGSKRPSWLHLGRLGLDDGKRSMALAIGD